MRQLYHKAAIAALWHNRNRTILRLRFEKVHSLGRHEPVADEAAVRHAVAARKLPELREALLRQTQDMESRITESRIRDVAADFPSPFAP